MCQRERISSRVAEAPVNLYTGRKPPSTASSPVTVTGDRVQLLVRHVVPQLRQSRLPTAQLHAARGVAAEVEVLSQMKVDTVLEGQRVRVALGERAAVRAQIWIRLYVVVEGLLRAVVGPQRAVHLVARGNIHKCISAVGIAVLVDAAPGIGQRVALARVSVVDERHGRAHKTVAARVGDHRNGLVREVVYRVRQLGRVGVDGIGASPVARRLRRYAVVDAPRLRVGICGHESQTEREVALDASRDRPRMSLARVRETVYGRVVRRIGCIVGRRRRGGIGHIETPAAVLGRQVAEYDVVYALAVKPLHEQLPPPEVVLRGEVGAQHLREAESVVHDIYRRVALDARGRGRSAECGGRNAVVDRHAHLRHTGILIAVVDPYERDASREYARSAAQRKPLMTPCSAHARRE